MKHILSLFCLLHLFLVSFAQREIKQVKIEEVEQLIAGSETPLVINFWATFCAPCIKEMPYLSSITDSMAKTTPVKLVFVSLDMKESYPEKIARFLDKKKIPDSCIWLNETNADHFCPKIDEKWSGSIPATLFVHQKTGYHKFLEQELTPEEYRQQLVQLVQHKK
ncbi:MAG: TlpA family protein disulfide reductase [Dinghuibacter sp.]|nr:TlpA family protein disulfide reductase [Dinghuibacter sp.]